MKDETAQNPELEEFLQFFTIPLEGGRQLVRFLLQNFLNLDISGIENIPQEGGGILVCNHTDNLDVFVQAVYTSRKLVFLGKVELFEADVELKRFLFQSGSPLNLPGVNLFRPILEKLTEAYALAQKVQLQEWGGMPIIRNYHGLNARETVAYYQEQEDKIVELLQKDGHLLVIFPEGTRSTTGLMGPFKSLTAKLAIRAGVPVIPAGISGAFGFSDLENMLSGRIFTKRIQYRVGEPILPADFPEGSEKRAAKVLTAELEQRVYDLTL